VRLLHVADWHLGRTTYNQSRQADHEAVLAEILGIAKEHKPHLIVHAGDLYDSARPAYHDMQLGIDALRELAAIAPVVVVRGNHDSAALFRVFSLLLGDGSRIHFVDEPRPPDEGGILEFPGDGDERIRLATLPFVHANRIITGFEDPAKWTTQYANRIADVEEALKEGLEKGYDQRRDILLFAAHLHVDGAVTSNSERKLTVGNDYATRLDNLPTVSYAAFGHIHRPQALPGGTVFGRYAGSPIPLDFGEEGEQKEVVLVEARPGMPAPPVPIKLKGGRPLRRIEGTLDEIRAQAKGVGNSLCLVVVNTAKPEPHLTAKVAEILPEAVLLDVKENCAARQTSLISAAAGGVPDEEADLRTLFDEFLSVGGTAVATVAAVREAYTTVIGAVEAQEDPHFDVLAKLVKLAQPELVDAEPAVLEEV
jgi:DNA repair protein SbcD/Mre11